MKGARSTNQPRSTRVPITPAPNVTKAAVISAPSVLAIVHATVCAAPSPPPPPEAPLAIKVTRDSVHLVWNNVADFTGAPVISYELEQRGNLRNNTTWTPVFPPWYPAMVSLSQSVNVPHRIPGIGLQYRVRARNCGGGELSASRRK